MKKIVSFISAVLILLTCPFSALAANSGTDYRSYLSGIETAEANGNFEISLSAPSALFAGAALSEFEGEKAVTFTDENGRADFVFSSENDMSCHIELTYVPVTGGSTGGSSVGIMINGAYPFNEAKELDLFWRWKNSEVTTDKRGNEILSPMSVVVEKTAAVLSDPSGRQQKPLLFGFKKGENKISVIANTGNFRLLKIKLFTGRTLKGYSETVKGGKATSGRKLILEAEKFTEASSTTLTPDYDKSSADTSPNDPVKLLYNYIPDEKYRYAGQWLKWEFMPEESGLYEISMRVRQNAKSGFTSSRRLYINGEVPFAECDEIKFGYSGDWYIKEFGEKEPYNFYFEKGKKYTLTLEVTAGSLSEITGRLDDLIYRLNSIYRSVIMVIGTDPDTYRDYQLGKMIPNFSETVNSLETELENITKELEKRNSGRSGSSLSGFHSLLNRLEGIKKNPDTLAKNISSFKSEISTLSSWNQDAKGQPLDIDYIDIHSPDKCRKNAGGSFFRQLAFDIKRIVSSFAEDYGTVGDVYDEASSLNIWMSAGRDQMNILKKLVDNSFAARYGINSNISLVTVDIRTAVLAGTAPDVSLFVSGDMPVNLALRGAVADLSKQEGFDTVAKRFESETLKPFEYGGGTYALPISETFNMMFVRTDVFEELGLDVPDTWEDFYRVSTILQRNNLEVGVPANIGMFATLLFQNGGSFYNEKLNGTEFGSEAAIKAFETWTGLFARYGFPLSYDFYNRFSSGEMPLAITDYTQYLKVEAASPELSGRWGMYLIPGTAKPDGSIDRTLSISAASGADTSPGLAQSVTSAVIFSGSKHRAEAWKFLDWFTSDETQSQYGREIEDALGSISRYTSANVNAFKSLPWSKAEHELLETQRGSIRAINEVSGNYSVTRELINAFRKVVYSNSNATDTIYTYNKRINKELARKNKESGSR